MKPLFMSKPDTKGKAKSGMQMPITISRIPFFFSFVIAIKIYQVIAVRANYFLTYIIDIKDGTG